MLKLVKIFIDLDTQVDTRINQQKYVFMTLWFKKEIDRDRNKDRDRDS